jgi:redox-sensitive bicupin YhaK (pirin superfamily)
MIDIRAAQTRAVTRTDWLDSRHSFSFGAHYEPDNTGFGLLLSCNEDTVAPGAGFGPHEHRDLEVVTWVLEGELAHEDDHGHRGRVGPGVVQRMSAGRGVSHSEVNANPDQQLRLVQMWLLPDEQGGLPSYEQKVVPEREGLVAVASGRGHDGAVRLRQAAAVLWVARGEVTLPQAPHVHVLITGEHGELGDSGELAHGDAVRLRDHGALSLRTDQALVWEMHAP